MNRLNLDFSLNTTNERASFVQAYLKQVQFKRLPPSEAELETIANYILWGKNPETGKNVKQEKFIELESRSKTWDAKEIDSLDALVESCALHESQIRSLKEPRYKTPKITFSRAQTRKEAPANLIPSFESLWREIDSLDLLINYYDLAHNRRKNPPRDDLLARFTESEQSEIKEDSTHLNQFQYLKMRHLLVELRREQFTLRDSYATQIQRQTIGHYAPPQTFYIGADLEVFPFGLINKTEVKQKVFNKDRFPIPSDFNEKELEVISKKLWQKKESSPSKFFDFRDLEHLYNLFLLLEDLEDAALDIEAESTLPQFLETVRFYVDRANLSDMQKDILKMKISKQKNQDIADYVNRKYEKTYNANYISTIFRQKIITQINAAAVLHGEILENIFFPENFKKCKDCGQVFLLSPTNFMRKNKSKDGFSTRCKKCEKEQRLRRASK